MGAPTINDMYLDTNNLIGDLKFPDVDMHCVYGTGILTERSIIYDKDSNFPNYPKKVFKNFNLHKFTINTNLQLIKKKKGNL